MAHTAPPSPARRRTEIGIAAVAVAAAVVLAVFAIIALHHPNGRKAPAVAAGTSSAVRSSGATSPTASTTASTTTAPSTTAPATTSAPPPTTSAPTTSPTPTKTKTTATKPVVSHPLAVSVMNNTSDSALSQTAITRLQAKGWSASNLGSFDGSILSTAVYYDPDVAGAEAQAEALQAEFPAIQRVVPKFDGLGGGPLVLMLTSDYS